MAWLTDTDTFIHFAFWAGVLTGASVALCCFAILVLRTFHLRRQRRLNRLLPLWRDTLSAAILGEFPGIKVSRGDRWHFIKLWSQLHDSVRGEAREALKSLARAMGMPKWALTLAAKRRLKDRLLGISALGRMGEFKGIDRLQKLLNHPDAVLSLTAAQAYARLVPSEALPAILKIASQRADWPTARLMDILREAGTEAASSPLLVAVSEAQGGPRKQLIPLLVGLNSSDTAAMVKSLLKSHSDAETLAATLPLATPENLQFVREAAEHASWFVRAKACQALGRMGTHEDLALLTRLAGDPQWWVRYRATEAMLNLPGTDIADLQHLADTHPDRYARDMLHMWLDGMGEPA